MDFTYDEEQAALQDAVRSLLAKRYGTFENRRAVVAQEPGFDESLWQRLSEMGVLGLPFAEEYGGMGAGPVEVGIVAAELGRVLAPEPFLHSVVLAGGLVALAGDDQQRAAILGPVAEGRGLPAFAHAEPGSRWQPRARTVAATGFGDRWRLSGLKEPVPWGDRATLLVVSAALPDGATGLFLVQPDAEGLHRQGNQTLDGSRTARLRFDATPATPLGAAGADQARVVEHALDLARVAAYAEVVGAMDAALAATTAYLKSRKQFGVPLSTFQALRFRAADMYLDLEMTRSLVLWATMRAASLDAGAAREAAARAGLQVSRGGRHLLQEAIQLHGGIGVTAEYPVGHFLTRLAALESLLGNGDLYARRLAERVWDHGEVDVLA